MFTKSELGNAIKHARKAKGLSSPQLAIRAGVAQSSLSDWENGKTQPSADALFKLCDALNITPTQLITGSFESTSYKIPVLGVINAGLPIEAVENIIDYEEIPRNMAAHGEYFALKIKGDSMIPTVKENDVVIVRKQEDAESGQICVVMINGYDATLKEIKKESNGIWVLPHNPNSEFKPTFYTNKEIEQLPVRILGVAVEIRRSL